MTIAAAATSLRLMTGTRAQSRRKFLLAISLALVFASSQLEQASALSVCPISDFRVVFEPGSSEIEEQDIETIDAAVARMRQCYAGAVDLIAEGDLESQSSLGAQRVLRLRDALIERGISADAIHAVNISRETYGQRTSPVPDAVIVMVYFN